MSTFEEEFIQDSIEEISRNIDRAKKSFGDLNALFREIHSIKGNAMAAGFDDLSMMAHVLEEKLFKLKESSGSLDDKLKNIIEAYFDICDSYFESKSNNLENKFTIKLFDDLLIKYQENIDEEDETKLNILIIDDEEDIVDLLKDDLENEYSCLIKSAPNGEKGLELVRKIKYDFIITDFNMPIMNGGEFLKKLRLSEEINKKTPVIILSGYRPKVDNNENIWENTFILSKPINFDELYYYIKCSFVLLKRGA